MKQQIPAIEDPVGHIVAFYHRGLLLFGCIIKSTATSLIILTTNGEQISLNSSRVILFSRDKYPLQLNSLTAFADSLRWEAMPSISIPEDGMDFLQLAERCNIQDDPGLFTLLLHLKNSPHKYFQKHEVFFARSAENEAEYLESQATQKARTAFLEASVALLKDPTMPEATCQTKLKLLTEIRAILLGEKIDDLQKVLKTNFPASSLSDLRVLLGDTLPIHDPPLLESGLPISFPEDQDQELLTPSLQTNGDTEAFCIDDEDSRDFDDAISLRALGDGFVLGIHVSNLALRLKQESLLFNQAKERVSSLYLASGVVPMLAPQYSEQLFSLRQDEEKPVLSLYATFDKDEQLIDTVIKTETIRISRNYSYKEVDKARQKDFWKPFFRIANKLRDQRDTDSKADERRFIYNLVAGAENILMKRVDMQSPARKMIEEFMILYNRSLADYAICHGIPMLFRNINRFYDAEKDWQNSTAYLDTKAGFHPGIGAEAYLHSTSPIRRFVDLVNQRQIHTHMREGTAEFDEEYLQTLILPIEKRIHQIRDTVQRSERYWLLRYIHENLMHSPMEGILRATSNGRFRVELLPWAKQVWLALDASPREAIFNFVVYDIDWDKLLLKADLIG